MYIYFFTAILSSIFILLSRVIYKKNRFMGNLLAIFSFLILWITAAVRFNVGTDFLNYYSYINRLDSIEVKNNEYGMWILVHLIKIFTHEGQFFIVLTSFIITFFIFYTIYKRSSYPELSILMLFGLGFYFNSLNAIRQYIAISIIFYSVQYLFKAKVKFYVFSVFVAMMFHFSSIVTLIFMPLTRFKHFTIKIRFMVILGFMLILIFYNRILIYIIPDQYSFYLDTRFTEEGANYIFLILYLLITIVLYTFKRKLIYENSKNEYYMFIILIGTGVSLLATQSLIFMRIASYFTIFSILVLPDLVKIVKDKNLRFITYFGLICISLLGMLLFLNQNLSEVLPYKTFFSK
ncbi:hypothetical protein GCM10009001_24530 [Virgibacillus siamensis]|uniref:EpsG family protein n=1 Tax=Virgibacillus siamensis TaxID=480071 RepID=A0ABP3RA49_9BACI